MRMVSRGYYTASGLGGWGFVDLKLEGKADISNE
jgi:hypothetical protein